MSDRHQTALEAMHSLAPLVIAVPVVVGIGVSVAHFITTRYPDLAWSQTLANDGKALATGAGIYARPGRQYTGMLYAPLLPAMLAPLYRLFWWDGWALLLALGSGVGLSALVGGVAASGPRRSRRDRIVSGTGVGGMAFWIVTTDPWNGLFTGRDDELAWLFALSGLCVLALAVAHNWPRMWPAVLLLSAAPWAKQPAAVALVAAIAVTTWWAAVGVMPWAPWRRFVSGLVLLNCIVLVALMVLTRGWVWFFFYDMPARHASDSAVVPYVSEFARLFAIPVAAVVTATGLGLWARRKGTPRSSFVALLTALLIAFLAIQVAPAFLARRRQGAGVNQYIGMLWAFGLLLALAHREARGNRRALAAGIAVYVGLASVALVPTLRDAITRNGVVEPVAMPRDNVHRIDPAVMQYAQSHLVYDTALGTVSPNRSGENWPHMANVADLLAAGQPVDYVVDALIDRRFDAVTPFSLLANPYVTQTGRTSPEYLPALNALVHAGYVRGANGAPAPLLGRRPGRVDLSWARPCFTTAHPAQCVAAGQSKRSS